MRSGARNAYHGFYAWSTRGLPDAAESREQVQP